MSPQRVATDLVARLGLAAIGPAVIGPAPQARPRPEAGPGGSDGSPGPPVPTAQLPLHLLTRIRELHARLDYDPV